MLLGSQARRVSGLGPVKTFVPPHQQKLEHKHSCYRKTANHLLPPGRLAARVLKAAVVTRADAWIEVSVGDLVVDETQRAKIPLTLETLSINCATPGAPPVVSAFIAIAPITLPGGTIVGAAPLVLVASLLVIAIVCTWTLLGSSGLQALEKCGPSDVAVERI